MDKKLKSPHLDSLLHKKRISRRAFLKGSGLLTASVALSGCFKTNNLLASTGLTKHTPPYKSYYPLNFQEITKSKSKNHTIAENYQLNRLISWGDPLFDYAGAFDPKNMTAESQSLRFGFNDDFIAYMPFTYGSSDSEHGLLCVNHEYPISRLMFDGIEAGKESEQVTASQVRVEQQALGVSVVEIKRHPITRNWQVKTDSRFNRRITATTPVYISGAAAGSPRLKTEADPTGELARGTLANCAGGTTPWGTVLTAEENINYYFDYLEKDNPEYRNHQRMEVGKFHDNVWAKYDKRFDLRETPNEPNRFGWVVEYDPYEPDKAPVKRTSLGRFKHECATTTVAPDGRVVVYSGDDEYNEYVYRFITDKPWNPHNRDANFGLLDNGVLYVARFEEKGNMQWLPLIYGQNGLDETNDFHSQADVLIEARRAGDIVGATPMDRPEDVEVNPVTGKLFVVLTKNGERNKVNIANPREPNPYGHILEITAPNNKNGEIDHTADTFKWDIFMEAGNPYEPSNNAYYQNKPSKNGWLTNPDNIAFDIHGRMWICTDGQGIATGYNEGLYVTQTAGSDKGMPRLLFTSPIGAEITGPCFTPDSKTLFLSVQHPGEYPDKSTFNNPSTRWPDFREDMPPRPSVVAISKDNNDIIGD